jgi:hypothetical protein
VIANVGNPYKKTTTPGGGGVPFQASVRIELQLRGKILEEGTKRNLGVDSAVCVVKNKVIEPFRSCKLRVMYSHGLIREHNLFEVASASGVIKKATANGWYEIDGHDGRFQEKAFWKEDIWKKAVEQMDVPPEFNPQPESTLSDDDSDDDPEE